MWRLTCFGTWASCRHRPETSVEKCTAARRAGVTDVFLPESDMGCVPAFPLPFCLCCCLPNAKARGRETLTTVSQVDSDRASSSSASIIAWSVVGQASVRAGGRRTRARGEWRVHVHVLVPGGCVCEACGPRTELWPPVTRECAAQAGPLQWDGVPVLGQDTLLPSRCAAYPVLPAWGHVARLLPVLRPYACG